MGKRSVLLLVVVLVVVFGVAAPAAMAAFGLEDFKVTFTNEDGSPATQAGSHPFAMRTSFAIKPRTGPEGSEPDGEAKDIKVALPVGFVGSPTVIPPCANIDFLTINAQRNGTSCPNSTVIGAAKVHVGGGLSGGGLVSPIFNLVPPPGAVAKFGFLAFSVPVTVEVGVNSEAPYNVSVGSLNISQAVPFFGALLEIWGNPASPAHDPFRGSCLSEEGTFEEFQSTGDCPTNVPAAPFLTLPGTCGGPLVTSFEADSWQDPGSWASGFTESPPGLTGCSRIGFDPTTSATPTTVGAASPTGLDFSLDVHDEGLTSPTGLAQSDIKKVVVALPEAMSVNPALAEGLSACGEADLQRETIGSAPGEGCPEQSKIGTLEVETPLLAQTLKGSLFLAKPYENPFGSLLALYVVVKNPETGILLKLPGKVEPNPVTGQLVSVFDDLPQLPFSHFRLHFRQGQRSPLVTPPGCGTYTTQAQLTPWTDPSALLHDTSTFQITSGIGGAPCPAGGVAPFTPGVTAGTINNQAGVYTPLDLRITRNDGEQEITGFSSLLPPGVTANLNGVPFCSEADIAIAKGKSGAREQSEPSCPVASEIGHTLVGVGVGSVLAYTPGKLYMAGPFEGAPFSVVSVTSAKAGPFDLGTVIVHLPLNIDPVTAQVSILAGAGDQIPHIVKGIVVHVRDIRVYVDRSGFTKNPTNCYPLALSAGIVGSGQDFVNPADDPTAGVSNPFQVANCANLAFKPSFNVSTSGKTSKANGASLTVKLAYPNAPQGTQANIHLVKVELPVQLPSRLTTLQKACTAAQFKANPAGCPAASVVGHAKAITPILPVPLEGPAYFVSNGGEAFPNLIIVLQGYGVTIDLVGSTFINKAGITSSTFKTVPDQPVSSFELTLPQGPYSALAANGNLCSLTKTMRVKQQVTVKLRGRKRTVTRNVKRTRPTSLTMPTEFIGQNGVVMHQTTRVNVTGCAKAKPVKRHKAKKSNARKRK